MRNALFIALIVASVFAVYTNTFESPFQFDDDAYIVKNPFIRDFSYFINPSSAFDVMPRGNVPISLTTRYIGHLSFYANHAVSGLDVRGFHLLNIAIHAVNAVLIYFIVLLIFKTPALSGAYDRRTIELAAVSASLMFSVHPVQTQAVTYISQRFTSLAALFSLLCILSYIKFRLTNSKSKYLFYALSIISSVLAMKTKESSFVMPLLAVLAEAALFKDRLKKSYIYLLPLLMTMLIIPYEYMTLPGSREQIMEDATNLRTPHTRWSYLLTESRAMITYLRLLVMPYSQNLDYDYPWQNSIFNPRVIISIAFSSCAVIMSMLAIVKNRKRAITIPALALLPFGTLWFYIAMSLESALVMLPDPINEHRAYLPSAGLLIAFAGALASIKSIRRPLTAIMIAVVLIYGTFAYKRNTVWATQVSLWEDTVVKSPKKPRARNNLAISYKNAGRDDDAIKQYEISLSLDPFDTIAHDNLGSIYFRRGMTDNALKHFLTAVSLKPDNADSRYNLGLAHCAMGDSSSAEQHYREAIRLNPRHIEARFNLALLYINNGRLNDARSELLEILRIDPSSARASAFLKYTNKI